MTLRLLFLSIISLVAVFQCAAQSWPAAKAPAVPQADGYVAIPNVAIAPKRSVTYRSIFDGTRFGARPDGILPVVNAVGGLLNDLVAEKVSRANGKFVIVFHGAAVDGILDDQHYRAKYGIDNPNLPVLRSLKKQGVELYVCGQHLAAEHIEPKTLSRDVAIASDAYLVLIHYQNRGYALMLF